MPIFLTGIIHFLKFNHNVYDVLIPKQRNINVIGYCRDGMLLGEFCYNKTWLLWKTFINRDIARTHQLNLEDQLLTQIYRQAQRKIHGPAVVLKEMHETLCNVLAVKGNVKH